MAEQTRERSHVLVVVPDDGDEVLGRSSSKETEISLRDLATVDVAMPVQTEQLGFSGPQPRVRHPMAEDAAHDRQKIEVARVRRCRATGQAISGDKQRPVEPPTVVRHQPGVRGDRRGEGRQECALFSVFGEQQLDLPEPVLFPPAQGR